MSVVLVTGATGFIGRNLCALLKEKGYSVRVAIRNNVRYISGVDEYIKVGDINESTDWQQVLAKVDTVIHLAARAHITKESAVDSLEVFRKVNVRGTERLARMAARAGINKFIFISSVKVNGEGSRRSYTENDPPEPKDAYGISKREAEDSLARVAAETGLQVVVLRLPLVYGPGVKANFKNLIKIVGIGLPLPLKSINNRRSFLYIGNLMDAIITCISHPLAAGETFMVSDCDDVSTPDLIKMLARAMGKKAVLFSLYPGILKALSKIIGRNEELEKLAGALTVDSGKISNLLGWKPPFTMEEGISRTIKGSR
ncbi:MAG: NAD-dependent epimerase/dehydratase family protein [Candidatus Omnitrophota bacterium]|nr:NAD-dependent epimerase/dehydratase family protein [Candidatus Omnitrophota bacterium]